MTRPLTGVRIIDLTRVLAGPFCTMLLADMGAEVIKIEEPLKGDDTRGYPPFDRGFSAYFANLNRNKKSVALDLKDNDSKEILWRMVRCSDVIVENYKPGTLAKLGFSYDALKEANPRIILASISGFGQYGPYTKRPGYDIIGQAMGGIMAVTGWPDSPPTRTGTAIGDILAGLNCCIGILAALKNRDNSGRGDWVDVSLVDSAVSAMETLIQIYLVEKRIPQRAGNRYEFIYPYDSFPASDGWVVLGIGNDNVWKRFCVAINREDLLNEERFRQNADRVKENEILRDIVTQWTSRNTKEDIINLLLANSVPCAPIYDVEQIVNDPHIAQARGMIVDVGHPVEGQMKVVGCPIKFKENPVDTFLTAPALGEHTEEIIKMCGQKR